ncbi:hypothetical protein JL720_8071 [Aureococcus anophagefferens]|nr:hypothetical protein JL720_8071 [Aureococcus anophagefferens]
MSQHVDRRDQFVRALWRHADTLRSAEHQAAARTSAVTALVRIGVHPEPLRSVAQARRVKSVGDRLEAALEAAGGPTATEPGKYACAAVALLAALLRLEATTSPAPLRPARSARPLGHGRRRRRRAPELVPSGAPSPDDVVVLVDEREGGGDAHHLPTIATFLKDEGVAYETRRLPTGFGDYAVARRRADLAGDRVDGVYPMLLERKSAVDVADSLRDGRWAAARRDAADRGPVPGGAALVYVVEGDPARHVHTACGCGCLGVGSCGNPNLAAVAAAGAGAVGRRDRWTRDVRATARLVAERYRAARAGFFDDAPALPASPPTTPGKRKPGATPASPPARSRRRARPRGPQSPQALRAPGPELPHGPALRLDAAARTGAGPLSKDDWMARAERCGVASVSLAKSGPMQYDGWSSCNGQLCSGQPSLVAKVNPGRATSSGAWRRRSAPPARAAAACTPRRTRAGAPARPRRPPATPRRRPWPSAPPPPGARLHRRVPRRRGGRAAAAAARAAGRRGGAPPPTPPTVTKQRTAAARRASLLADLDDDDEDLFGFDSRKPAAASRAAAAAGEPAAAAAHAAPPATPAPPDSPSWT